MADDSSSRQAVDRAASNSTGAAEQMRGASDSAAAEWLQGLVILPPMEQIAADGRPSSLESPHTSFKGMPSCPYAFLRHPGKLASHFAPHQCFRTSEHLRQLVSGTPSS